MGMGMNHWEWEGIVLKKTFPLTSSPKHASNLTRAISRHKFQPCPWRRSHISRRGTCPSTFESGGARRGTGLEQLQMPIGKILALFD